MLIAIDYDLTYTADPDFWDHVISVGRDRGHEFVCITGRESPPCGHERQIPTRILCAPDEYKGRAARKAGLMVDVWIDDAPGAIEPGRMLEWEM